jgi:hypothetical protein
MKNKESIVISRVLIFLLGLSTFVAGTVPETYANKVKAGEFVVEPPTLICLGFEWHIDGDDNRNATVDVHYRNVKDMDFRLKRDSAAVDAGCILPNINDGFTGKAPDLGALEVGQAVPIYGPRP